MAAMSARGGDGLGPARPMAMVASVTEVATTGRERRVSGANLQNDLVLLA